MGSKTKILFIGHNFSPEPTGIGKYSGEMLEWLTKDGHDCTVITTYPYYPYWKVQSPYKNGWYKKESFLVPGSDKKITIYRCPLYVPGTLDGKRRMLHDLSFFFSMFFVVLKLIIFNQRFDYIITVAPSFHLGYLGLLYRKLRGGKLIYHVQDLQIEAAQGSQLLKGGRLFNFLYKAEKIILEKSNYVSGISQGMIAKIKLKVDRDIIFFPNWVKTSLYFPVKDKDSLKQKWGYTKDHFICLYSGSIGEKQGLENIIHAAEVLKQNSNIKFVICGTGPYKSKLQHLTAEKGLKNIAFVPLQDKEEFNNFLNMADMHLIIQKGYISDLVMPSKLSTILSAGGVSLVTADENTSLYNLYKNFDVGYIVPSDNYVKLAEAISTIQNVDISEKQHNARKYALQYLNIDNVMTKFMDEISDMPNYNKVRGTGHSTCLV